MINLGSTALAEDTGFRAALVWIEAAASAKTTKENLTKLAKAKEEADAAKAAAVEAQEKAAEMQNEAASRMNQAAAREQRAANLENQRVAELEDLDRSRKELEADRRALAQEKRDFQEAHERHTARLNALPEWARRGLQEVA
jgi:hypothetical protein